MARKHKFAKIFLKIQDLEEETSVDVERSLSVLLVEATCVFERYDEVLVHDESESTTHRSMETILA